MIFKLTLYATKYDLKSNTDITFLSYPCLKLPHYVFLNFNKSLIEKDKVLFLKALTFRLRNMQGHAGDWSSSL